MLAGVLSIAQHRAVCVLTLWLSGALAPAMALSPVEQPIDAMEALEDFRSADLAWTSPKMRDFMQVWFDVTELDEPPCGPADMKLSPITTVCEYKPDNQTDLSRPPRLLVGIVGKDANTARIVSVVSERALNDVSWNCRPSQLNTVVCTPVGGDSAEDDRLFTQWDKWLPRTESEWFAWHATDPEMRYIQSAVASGGTMPADVPRLLSWKNWQGEAMNTVRIERLVMIGQLCRVLDQADAETITRNARVQLSYSQFALADQDRRRAKEWLKALRIGATQSARLSDATDEASCKRFAAPYGTLSKLLTWTDKQQEASPGVRASPRTLP
ncbi:hypothetical protein N018_12555 [Pseudomonas syringae CC1557]|uniref:Uncharacterized protein n=1 Tax=Pseudomonas syringae CC1557 TaxID=1357279 RepID=W0MYT2_PSESX|nr:hypothetical protein [Pseudomonas syringae]AHG43592.1 hypothetical protein N018_12555 [Pseudomonas syringae CC1557]